MDRQDGISADHQIPFSSSSDDDVTVSEDHEDARYPYLSKIDGNKVLADLNEKKAIVNLERLPLSISSILDDGQTINLGSLCLESEQNSSNILLSERKPLADLQDSDTVSMFSLTEDEDDSLIKVNFLDDDFGKKSNSPPKAKTKNKKACSVPKQETSYTIPNLEFSVKSKYKFSLDTILNEKEHQRDVDEKIERLENELKNEKFQASSTILNENQLQWQKFSLECSSIKPFHPGMKVFNPNSCFCLYQVPAFPEASFKKSNSFDAILSKINPDDFPKFLTRGSLQRRATQLATNTSLLTYFYHLMASHPDCHVVHCCYKILLELQQHFLNEKTDQITWAPVCEDVIATLVNCGANLTLLMINPYLEKITDKELYESFHSELDETQNAKNKDQNLPCNNIQYIFKILFWYLEVPLAYTNVERAALHVLCCIVALDENISKIFVLHEIKQCIAVALDRMEDVYWESEINELKQASLKFTSHHHDMVFLCQLMPYTKRGLQLQKLMAFWALHVLVGFESDHYLGDVKPHHVYEFFKENLIKNYEDYYLLHSIISLVDLCIGTEPNNSSKKVLQDLIGLLRDLAAKTRDRIQCPATTEVKNFMIGLANKWTFIVQSMPSSQKNIFNYVTTQYDTKEVKTNSASDEDDTVNE